MPRPIPGTRPPNSTNTSPCAPCAGPAAALISPGCPHAGCHRRLRTGGTILEREARRLPRSGLQHRGRTPFGGRARRLARGRPLPRCRARSRASIAHPPHRARLCRQNIAKNNPLPTATHRQPVRAGAATRTASGPRPHPVQGWSSLRGCSAGKLRPIRCRVLLAAVLLWQLIARQCQLGIAWTMPWCLARKHTLRPARRLTGCAREARRSTRGTR